MVPSSSESDRQKRIMMRICGPKWKEVAGSWRRLHNKELYNLHATGNIIRVIKSRNMIWEGHVARIGEMRNVYKIFVGKPERIKSLGRPRCRWENKSKMDVTEVEWKVETECGLTQDWARWRAPVDTVMNLRVL